MKNINKIKQHKSKFTFVMFPQIFRLTRKAPITTTADDIHK